MRSPHRVRCHGPDGCRSSSKANFHPVVPLRALHAKLFSENNVADHHVHHGIQARPLPAACADLLRENDGLLERFVPIESIQVASAQCLSTTFSTAYQCAAWFIRLFSPLRWLSCLFRKKTARLAAKRPCSCLERLRARGGAWERLATPKTPPLGRDYRLFYFTRQPSASCCKLHKLAYSPALATSSLWVPSSARRPWSSTMILSAFWLVFRRCATG